MATDKIFGAQEIMDILKKAAIDANHDSFRCKISRRENQAQLGDFIASFDGCTLEHLNNPETWLPILFGGGWYSIALAHSGKPGDNLGGHLKFSYPPSNSMQVKRPSGLEIAEIMSQPSWAGPTVLKWPIPEALMKGTQTFTVGDPLPTVAVAAVKKETNTLPVVNETSAILAQAAAATQPNSVERLEVSRLSQANELLSREKNEIAQMRMQMEQESFRNEMKLMLSANKPSSGGSGGMMEVVGVLTPILLKFMDSKAEGDRFALQMQIDAANRQAEFMKSMMAKPATVDPMIEKLVEKIDKMSDKKDDMGHMKMVGEMMTMMASTSMQLIQSQAELVAASQPEQESPQFKLAGKALEALSAVFGKVGPATAAVIDDSPVPPQQALPEGIPEGIPEKPKYTQLELLERSLKRKDAKEKVLERFAKAMASNKFKAFVRTQYKNDLLALIQDRLGPWAMTGEGNLTYLQETCTYVFEEATKQGILRVKKAAVAATEETNTETNGVDESHPVSQENTIPAAQATVTA